MGKKYKVVWTEIAESDLMAIIEYIAIDSLPNALKILNKVKKKVSNLCYSPKRGRITPELQVHGILQYRELTIAPWRVGYRVSGQMVYVLYVLDSRRNIEDILLNRLINSKY